MALFLLLLFATLGLLILTIPSSPEIRAQESGQPPLTPAEERLLFYTLVQSVIAVVGIAAGVGITFYLYWRGEKERRLDIIARSCQTILWELQDNRKTLTDGNYQKVSYNIGRTPGDGQTRGNGQQIHYTNAYLYDEAYKTLINSGSLSYFKSDTQYKLVSLYGRIKSHNELLTYADQLQDQVLLSGIHAPSTDKENILFKLRERYDLTLTKWETEISGLIPELEKLIELEKPRRT